LQVFKHANERQQIKYKYRSDVTAAVIRFGSFGTKVKQTYHLH